MRTMTSVLFIYLAMGLAGYVVLSTAQQFYSQLFAPITAALEQVNRNVGH